MIRVMISLWTAWARVRDSILGLGFKNYNNSRIPEYSLSAPGIERATSEMRKPLNLSAKEVVQTPMAVNLCLSELGKE